MIQNLTISKRGQITLPAELRKEMGFKPGSTVIAEIRDNELVLRPATVLEIEIYSDKDIERWNEEDQLDEQTRQKIYERLGE